MRILLLFLIFFTHSIQFVDGQAVSNFTVDRYNICSGTSLSLTNLSTGANTFQWRIDGVHYSYSKDTTVVLVEPCYDLKEIRLTVGDSISLQYDSSSIVVEVFDSCFFHWNGDYLLCPGDTVRQLINSEEISTQFIITPPHNLLSGCLTCPSIEFVLTTVGTSVERYSTYFGGCTEQTSYHYICGVGTNELIANEAINIFPNPANRKITISSSKMINAIQFLNTQGETILLLDQVNEQKSEINIERLKLGMYFVLISQVNGSVQSCKFVKN